MNKEKEVVREKISEEIVRALDMSKIQAIAFAEVGAQWRGNFISVISDLGDRIVVDEGHFGFEAFGIRYDGDVEIDQLEEAIPFLKHFRGVSRDTTARGHFLMENGEWIHLDAIFGNHFFLREALIPYFRWRMIERGSENIFRDGVDVMLGILNAGTEGSSLSVKTMMGAIVGDIVGSRFEWHNRKSKEFTFLKGVGESRHPCCFTDDTVMTVAVADAILKWKQSGGGSYEALSAETVRSMQAFGRRFPHAGYGGSFRRWLRDANPQPYNSWGNGSAMRVSACGWAGRTLDEVKAMSRAVTEVTHNHPEGIKGAEATAVATFLARTGKSMEEIREVIVRDYYPLNFTLNEIRPVYEFDVSCQGSVPPALEAFFESTSFEDAIRNAISIGGDSDTIGAICGAVAGAYYGIPVDICERTLAFLDPILTQTLEALWRLESSQNV